MTNKSMTHASMAHLYADCQDGPTCNCSCVVCKRFIKYKEMEKEVVRTVLTLKGYHDSLNENRPGKAYHITDEGKNHAGMPSDCDKCNRPKHFYGEPRA